jgi:hypothetical protein
MSMGIDTNVKYIFMRKAVNEQGGLNIMLIVHPLTH